MAGSGENQRRVNTVARDKAIQKAAAAVSAGTHHQLPPERGCEECRISGRICAITLIGGSQRCLTCKTRTCRWNGQGVLHDKGMLEEAIQELDSCINAEKRRLPPADDASFTNAHIIELETAKKKLQSFITLNVSKNLFIEPIPLLQPEPSNVTGRRRQKKK
ncbi:hypothetical protein IAU59_007620 [Kwoniella sp. CBS 9459]